MKKVNSLSGGKTSSFLAYHYPADYEVFSLVCIDDNDSAPKDKNIIQYANDKLQKFIPDFGEFIATAEDDKTLYVMRDLEQLLGREIIWVRGKSFDNVINGRQTRLPSWARRYCTEQMKLEPIFKWWLINIGEKVEMRIGFRFDEFTRMENFFNNSDPTNFSIPVSCKTYGNKQQVHQSFNWRKCTMPLIRDAITSKTINTFWENKFIGGDLFQEPKKIEFPIISNCVGCFHKKPETLCIMASLNREKIEWFSNQELKGKGTWLDSKIPYSEFLKQENWIPEMMTEQFTSCDSGGCTD